MTLKVETRFNIGDLGYYLDDDHTIRKGIVREVKCTHDVYKSWYDDLQKSCTRIEYILRIEDIQDSKSIFEDHLFKDPNEIVAILNDQIEKGEFD